MEIVTKETFKTKVQKLVEHFSDNEEFYKSKEYKEDHLRQEFINPFFKALGWDMDNEQGFAPQYREVIHEDRIEIEGKPKAPDYAFKVGSDRKFFVEAKATLPQEPVQPVETTPTEYGNIYLEYQRGQSSPLFHYP